MTHIFAVPTASFDEFWPSLRPFIAMAAARYSKDYDLTDVEAAIRDEKALLFGIKVGADLLGAMTVTPIRQPKRQTLEIELVGGKNAKMWYSDTVDQLATLAKSGGYDAIRSTARKGWRDMAKRSGFTEAAVVYEMELTHGSI